MRSHEARKRGRRFRWTRVALLLVFAAGALQGVLGGPLRSQNRPIAVASKPVMFVPSGQTAPEAAGQITAHNGKFWLGGQQIKLRGINIQPSYLGTFPTDADFARISSWGMNFVRFHVPWSTIEPLAPTKVGGSWTHRYDTRQIVFLRKYISFANDHGLYVVLSDGGIPGPSPPLTDEWWPDWLYLPPYNSHQMLYVDPLQAQTDYWTDDLQQRFTRDYWGYMAQQFAASPGLIGYEPLNEPQRGNLPNLHATTQTAMDTALEVATVIRNVDPPRVVIFMTRGCCGEGVANADFSGFVALGNVALDVHNFFGGRWGFGLMMDPTGPDYSEVHQVVQRFTLSAGPYLGTTTAQVNILQNYAKFLDPVGIPFFIGEFSADPLELNARTLMGTTTAALNSEGLSWAVYGYTGKYGIVKLDGTLMPWASIVIAAATAP